jgi:hypothetical protein
MAAEDEMGLKFLLQSGVPAAIPNENLTAWNMPKLSPIYTIPPLAIRGVLPYTGPLNCLTKGTPLVEEGVGRIPTRKLF